MNRSKLTDQKMKEKLHYYIQMLNETQSLSKIGSWNWDLEASKVEWTDMMYNILGLDSNACSPSPELALHHVHNEDKEFYLHTLNNALANKKAFILENRIVKKDNSIIFVISRGRCILDKEGNLIRMIGTVQDISEIKELESNLKKERELNDLKSRFVTMASHEFRTPLSSVLSSASLIGRYDQFDQQDKRIKHVNRIKASVKNLTNILNDFLSLEKLESGKINCNLETLNIENLMEEILEETKVIVQDNQKVRYKHSGEKMIIADKHLLKHILLNLLSNAIKYSPKGGDIELISKKENELLEIKVKDKGLGIPLEDQKHIFSHFFRGENVSNIQGTGLGLIIVKQYLDLMKGQIDFESEENVSTTFRIVIPQ